MVGCPRYPRPYKWNRRSKITNRVFHFLGLWMGGDNYDTIKICGEKLYQQLKSMKEIIHPRNRRERLFKEMTS